MVYVKASYSNWSNYGGFHSPNSNKCWQFTVVSVVVELVFVQTLIYNAMTTNMLQTTHIQIEFIL